jgi:catechol-2,3-dioxygenase
VGLKGVHIGLTVTDPAASADWYENVFGAQRMMEDENAVFFMIPDDLILGLLRHEGTRSDDRFSHERVGLDHFAVHCGDRAELEKWEAD